VTPPPSIQPSIHPSVRPSSRPSLGISLHIHFHTTEFSNRDGSVKRTGNGLVAFIAYILDDVFLRPFPSCRVVCTHPPRRCDGKLCSSFRRDHKESEDFLRNQYPRGFLWSSSVSRLTRICSCLLLLLLLLLQTWRYNTTVGTKVAPCRQPSCSRASVYFCSF
jgi:hypothetical protein